MARVSEARNLTPEQVAEISRRNRASRTHKLGDTGQDSRDDTSLTKPAQNARHGDPGKESVIPEAKTIPLVSATTAFYTREVMEA